MAECDRTTARVESLHRIVERALPHERDRGERLVALDRVPLVGSHAAAFHELVGDGHGRAQHEHRVFGCDRKMAEPGTDRQVVQFREVGRRDDHRRRAIRHLRRVRRSDVGRGLLVRHPRRR